MLGKRQQERNSIFKYAVISDRTEGNINIYINSYKPSLSNTNQIVIFNKNSKCFGECILEGLIQNFVLAPKGYLVLKNLAKNKTHPKPGGLNNSNELLEITQASKSIFQESLIPKFQTKDLFENLQRKEIKKKQKAYFLDKEKNIHLSEIMGEAKAITEKIKAIILEFIALFQSFVDKQLLEKLTKTLLIPPLSEKLLDVFSRLLQRTKLEPVFLNLNPEINLLEKKNHDTQEKNNEK